MFMIMLNNLLKMHLKLPKRAAQKKTAEATGDSIVKKYHVELWNSQELYHKIVLRQLKMRMIKIPKETYISSEERQKVIKIWD